MILRIFFALFLSFSVSAKGFLNYAEAVDVYELLNTLSYEVGSKLDGKVYNSWKKRFGLTREDKVLLSKFKVIRQRYLTSNEEFDQFSLAFYRSSTVDQAVKKLKRILKEDELSTIVSVLKHFKKNASVLIKQSVAFRGMIKELEKKYKKDKVFKIYDKVFKFFNLNKKFKAKIFFTWWPKDKGSSIKITQNIIFIKINPNSNVGDSFNKDEIMKVLIKSLFSSLGRTHRENFENIVFPSCQRKNFYNVLSYALGPLQLESSLKKKQYDPLIKHFKSSKENIKAILFANAFEQQLKVRGKFYGVFPHKLKFICEELNSI